MDPSSSLAIVVNTSAGTAGHDELEHELRTAFPQATILDVGDDFIGTLEQAATFEVMGIVGGDGSINAAASVSIETRTPLVVIPGGTLNHFARDAGLDSMDDAIDAVAVRRLVRIDAGRIDGEVFVNTASFGSYPELVDEREQREDRLGKWLALLVAAFRILPGLTPTDVSIDGKRHKVWLFFAGNGVYDPPGLAPTSRAQLDDGLLDIRWIDAGVRFSRLRTMFALVLGPWGRSRGVKRIVAEQVVIESHQGPLRLARDGETFDGGTRIVIEKDPRGLDVFLGPED